MKRPEGFIEKDKEILLWKLRKSIRFKARHRT